MTNSNNDIEELEELLSELEGQEAQIVTPYSEEDDAVTRLMDAPLGDQDWMVQVTALDRRMMSTNQLLSELQVGKVNSRTLVWRTGMDDWMPVSRIDELTSHGNARVNAAPHGMSAPAPRNSSPRAAFPNLAPPPPPPQASQPLWSSPSAPLPPPPSSMSPPFGMAPGGGLPPPPLALQPPPPPPIALTPPPPAPSSSYGLPKPAPMSAPPPEAMSHGNTTRPVAVDFSDMPPENDAPLQSKRWVMALSAVAILAVFVTVYSLSSGGGESEAKATAAAKPQAVSALQPAAKEKPAASAAATPAPTAKPTASAAANNPEAAPAATAKASDGEDESEASSSSSARQTAQARYSPRSEYRRRSRGGSSSEDRESARSSEAEERAKPAPAAAAPSSTARAEEADEPASEPVAAVADEVDEPPKSTSKSSGNTFNREAAKAALDEAAGQAKNCRPQGGPSGTGQVQVRYEPSGKVSNVTILTSKFDNTTAGSCVRMLFRRAKVPEFTGAPVVVVNKSFEIP
jgi:hypothetical protein